MDTLARNVRHSIRRLARAPGFTLTALLTLGIAIGANSAVFSAIDAVLLRPLSFPDGDRLVQLREIREQPVSGAGFVRAQDWDRLNSTFESISAYATFDASDTTGETPERVRTAGVAPRFLDVWGVAPALGRGFVAADHRSGESCARLVSDRYWRTRLGSDPNVLGRIIRINNVACEIVGVMPASFLFPDGEVDVWNAESLDAPWLNRTAFLSYLTAVGRLKAGVTPEQARVDLGTVQTRLAEQFPETDRGIGVGVVPLKDVVVGSAGGTLWLLFGAVSLLLLIACTNIAALLLARATRREQEIQVRYSIGASRAALVGQLLTEAGVLAAGGAALGLVIATGASAAFRTLAPNLPRLTEVGVDSRILLYALAMTIVVTLLSGLFPALRSSRGAGWGSGMRQVSSRQSLQWTLVGVQVALSVTLLAGAGLLLRSFDALSRVDRGFDAEQVLAFRLSQVYDVGLDRAPALVDGWLEGLAAVPGVLAAGVTSAPLGAPSPTFVELDLDDGRAAATAAAEFRIVSPGYFTTLGIPLVAGEMCGNNTVAGAAQDVLVNRRLAETSFAGRSPLGSQLRLRSGPGPRRIVGVVGDARESGLGREPAPTVYRCGVVDANPWVLVRTRGEPGAASASVRQKMRELEPLRSVYPIGPLEDQIAGTYAQDRLRTVLLASFAAAALSLACLGVYGTLSYVVGQRRREVGLRVALGAQRGSIVAQFLGKALRVVAIACGAGLALSLASSQLVSGMLFGISPFDPPTLALVVALVTAVAAAAALLPAVRAARVDPMQALREE